MDIRNFKPGKYYSIQSSAVTHGEKVELSSKLKFTKDELDKAEETAKLYNETGAVVTHVSSKSDKILPGKLYSLSTLQNVLGKKYKMSMADSLKIIQGLYERGFLTYPRTNSEYLATAEKDKMKKILSAIIGIISFPIALVWNERSAAWVKAIGVMLHSRIMQARFKGAKNLHPRGLHQGRIRDIPPTRNTYILMIIYSNK